MRKEYDTEALKISKVIDIAIDSYIQFPPKDFTEANIDHVVNLHREWKNSILNPEPRFKKIASLNHYIQDVFTYFQEGVGETVEYFWHELAKEKLDYIREDSLRKIIDRKKIRSRIEYDLVIDSIVVAEQEKRITSEESKALNEMIGQFENRQKKKAQ